MPVSDRADRPASDVVDLSVINPGVVDPGVLARAADRQEGAIVAFNAAMRGHVLALIDDRLIAEHRDHPFGPHGAALQSVLNHFRSAGIEKKLAILALTPFQAYILVALSGVRGVLPTRVTEEVFATTQDAEHAIFLRRVAALRQAG
ncbi:hypothetical protein [Acuticoccus mangrovi]|uniref:N,N-dimethylformamidase alpha subunit domain-containing protein n=1 Tax=Acuticoccus mangrovi TaxID=2796142 RepID=A0A934IKB1_9HYPH|nr:hypothetical protein [Acuticoccus mangrovi]MBJ3778068.1 hypothetical protein [Acuticoccus mangrovi]